MEKVFERVELVSYNEHKKIRSQDTELVISAHPSGSAIGGAAWNIEYNKQLIVYAVDLNDSPMNITMPMMRFSDFKNANILITNAYLNPKMQLLKPASIQSSLPNSVILPTQQKVQKFLSEEKLRVKLERVLVDAKGQILIPISDKNQLLQCLITLENIFKTNTRLQGAFRETVKSRPVIYLEHMSRDTLGVGRSHPGWMNFKDNKVFQDIDENPINFQYVKEIFSISEYRDVLNQEGEFEAPRVVVTSMVSMDYGFSRSLLKEFLARPKNEILFLQLPTDSKSLGYKLLVEGEKEVLLHPDIAIKKMSQGDSANSDYIGAQRRDNEYLKAAVPAMNVEMINASGIPSEQFQETALQKKLNQAEVQIK